jgi:hypothetical protein
MWAVRGLTTSVHRLVDTTVAERVLYLLVNSKAVVVEQHILQQQ